MGNKVIIFRPYCESYIPIKKIKMHQNEFISFGVS